MKSDGRAQAGLISHSSKILKKRKEKNRWLKTLHTKYVILAAWTHTLPLASNREVQLTIYGVQMSVPYLWFQSYPLSII